MSEQDGGSTETNHTGSGSAAKHTRVTLTDAELEQITVPELAARWRQQDIYVTILEQRLAQQEGETNALRENEERLRSLYAESQQREKVLVRRLAAKEQETQDYVCQLAELKAAQVPSSSSLRSTLVDPSVNVLLQLLRQELQTTRTRLEDTQNELTAWKFTPDSNTGKRLMAKCRLLYQENEELGKMTSSGRLAKLEGELALQKSFSEEVKKSQLELDEFLQDLDEDVEGMQSTIYYLQQELRKSNETIAALQAENNQMRSVRVNGTAHPSPASNSARPPQATPGAAQPPSAPTPAALNSVAAQPAAAADSVCDRRTDSASDSEPELIIKVSEQEMCDEDSDQPPAPAQPDGDAAVSAAALGVKRTYESDSSTQDAANLQQSAHARTSRTKKVRRRLSVLSLDYNDDDALVISTNGDVAMSDAE